MSKSLSEIYRSYRRSLIIIGITHILLVVLTLWVLYELNLKGDGADFDLSSKMIIINASLLGFLGSLLYFSRKIYSYLISDKFHRVLQDKGVSTTDADSDIDKVKSIVSGYYIYLSTRPIAGFVIGPLLLMSVLAGFTTFYKPTSGTQPAMSTSGIYLIYIVSFIGGYSSSDIFDYLSNLGKKIISNIDLKQRRE